MEHSRSCSHYNAVYRRPLLEGGEAWMERVQEVAPEKVHDAWQSMDEMGNVGYGELVAKSSPLIISWMTTNCDNKSLALVFMEMVKNTPTLARESVMSSQLVSMALRWHKLLPKKEKHLVPIYMVLRHMGRAGSTVIPAHYKETAPCTPTSRKTLLDMWVNDAGPHHTIPAYALDKHTAEGRAKGADKTQFVKEGAMVKNQSEHVDPVFLDFYTKAGAIEEAPKQRSKKRKAPNSKATTAKKQKAPVQEEDEEEDRGGLLKESDVFMNPVRCQLNTSRGRPDTYFCQKKNLWLAKHFVKGPFLDGDKASLAVAVNEMKRLYFPELSFVTGMMRVDLIPDLLEDTALGARTVVEAGKTYAFVMCNDLVGYDRAKTTKKSSKMWPPTKVVDWKKLADKHGAGVVTLQKLNHKQCLEVARELLFRLWLGIPDQAWRNFVCSRNGTMVAVDESNIGVVDLSKTKHLKSKELKHIMSDLLLCGALEQERVHLTHMVEVVWAERAESEEMKRFFLNNGFNRRIHYSMLRDRCELVIPCVLACLKE